VDLRSLFVLTFCLAIGFTIGSAPVTESEPNFTLLGIIAAQLNWHFAMLAAASTSIAIGLIQHTRAIRRKREALDPSNTKVQFGLWLESTCRLLLAALLLTCLMVQVLIVRGYVSLPENDDIYFYGDLFTTYVWWLALGIALSDMVSRARRPPMSRPRPLINILVWIGAVALGFYIIWDHATVTFLVHAACRGVDATLVHTGNRYPLWTEQDEIRFLALVGAAAAAVLVAATLLVVTLSRPTRRRWLHRTAIAAAVALLGGAAAYCHWYYRTAFPAISPDLAVGGFCSTWFQQLGGAVLAAVAVVYASYRATRAAAVNTPSTSVIVESQTISDSLPTILLLLIGAIIFFVLNIRATLSDTWAGPLESLAYLLVYPDTYFMLAISLLSLKLGWLRWKRRVPAPIRILPLESLRFATALLTFTAFAAVAIPTFAALGFAFWLGPWYRW